MIAYSFIGVIAGEFVLSGAGIGHEIAFAYNNFDNPTMYGLMLLLIGFVSGLNMLLFAWERRFYQRRGLTYDGHARQARPRPLAPAALGRNRPAATPPGRARPLAGSDLDRRAGSDHVPARDGA